jgi:AP-1-like factor
MATETPSPSGFILTPQQQSLLLAALNSGKQNQPFSTPMANGGLNPLSLSPNSLKASPQQQNDFGSLQDSPLIDGLDYEFGPDSSFDFDFANESQGGGSGDNPGTVGSESTDNDNSEKRAHPDNDDEDGSITSPNGAKRREGVERVPKKPGRKPLTSEPTSVCAYPDRTR